MTPYGQALDSASLGLFSWLGSGVFLAAGAFRAALPLGLGAAGLAAIGIGLAKGRIADCLRAAGGVSLGFVLSTVLRDYTLIHPNLGQLGYQHNTYPSGHVTVAVLTGVAVVNLIRWHSAAKAVMVLSFAATLVGVVSVAALAHRASDVIGGIALAGIIAPWMPSGYQPRLSSSRRFPSVPVAVSATGAVGISFISIALATSSSTLLALGIAVLFLLAALTLTSRVLRFGVTTTLSDSQTASSGK
ncbi:phosphatase PAP2 family protein [Paramicrobacterium humi]